MSPNSAPWSRGVCATALLRTEARAPAVVRLWPRSGDLSGRPVGRITLNIQRSGERWHVPSRARGLSFCRLMISFKVSFSLRSAPDCGALRPAAARPGRAAATKLREASSAPRSRCSAVATRFRPSRHSSRTLDRRHPETAASPWAAPQASGRRSSAADRPAGRAAPGLRSSPDGVMQDQLLALGLHSFVSISSKSPGL